MQRRGRAGAHLRETTSASATMPWMFGLLLRLLLLSADSSFCCRLGNTSGESCRRQQQHQHRQQTSGLLDRRCFIYAVIDNTQRCCCRVSGYAAIRPVPPPALPPLPSPLPTLPPSLSVTRKMSQTGPCPGPVLMLAEVTTTPISVSTEVT